MSPREVEGLQALAMAHGGSLTINPETGLPEAGFLDSILPAVAGFALNAFAPGVGTAVGGMLGLGSAAGTALTVGGIAGLASGSLEKGIMAGMGAYGGAGLSGSMMNSGTNAAVQAAEAAIPGGGPLSPAEITAARQSVNPMDSLKSGFSAAASNPKDFLQDNKYLLGAALLPALAGGLGDDDGGAQAPARKKYNMSYARDPISGALYDTSGEGITYGGVGRSTRGMADGGEVMNPMTEAQRLNSIATETNGPNAQVAYDTRTDSQKALAYLMGEANATNPMLFTHKAAAGPVEPADMLTRTGGHYVLDAATNTYTWVPDAAAPADTAGLAALNNQNRGGRDKVESSNPTWDAMSDFEKAGYFAQNPGMAKFDKFATGLLNSGWVGSALGMIPGVKEQMEKRAAINTSPEAYLAYMGSDILNPKVQQEALHPESDAGLNTDTSDTTTGGEISAPTGPVGGGSVANPMSIDPSQGGGRSSYSGMSMDSGKGDGEGHGDHYAAAGGLMSAHYANGGIAALAGGGLGSLGGYSDGGQLLKGPGDGVSDSIPAKIAGNQPARLADGEFVVPARIVSEIGNGSTDAGARELYKMMARIQAGRKKTVGKNKVAVNSKAARHLPA
jgi:hypothetical protein